MQVDMKTLPERMKLLPVDDRGYPVPWFVPYVEGKPEFRGMEFPKFVSAIKQKLCWVCGGNLGVHKTFVAGPMCGINRTSSEPPCHYDCALWSAINCPFLSNPRMVRRTDDMISNTYLTDNAAGVPISRNPGVVMLWNTREYEVFKVNNGYLLQMGTPESIEWYAEGRKAKPEEIENSIETGIPSLEIAARQEKGGLESLHKAVERFRKLNLSLTTT